MGPKKKKKTIGSESNIDSKYCEFFKWTQKLTLNKNKKWLKHEIFDNMNHKHLIYA